ncbi:MAG: hypothetical protein J6U26_02515, partial [Lachnospiraceae bacterium]|nr:hypothetical protein [Lachnospiraceae bacterium]
MKKQEYQELLKTGVELVEQEQYGEAVRIFDSLNLDGIRSPGILQRVAKAYERSQRYMDAEDILLQAHQAAPKSRGTLYHLTLIALKANEPGSAESYYRKFCDVAGHDPMRFALQYRIARAKGAPDSELIRILENYRDEEPDDRWMYELARLYATNGRTQEAVEVCDTILVWYNSGKYWERAREMKAAITGIEPEPLPSETEAYAAEAMPAAVLPAAALASTRDVFAGTDEALAAAIRATEEEIIGGASAEETRGAENGPAEENVPVEEVAFEDCAVV